MLRAAAERREARGWAFPAVISGDPEMGPTARRTTGAAYPHQRLPALCSPLSFIRAELGMVRRAKRRGKGERMGKGKRWKAPRHDGGAANSAPFPSPLRGGARGGGQCSGQPQRAKRRPPSPTPPRKGGGSAPARGRERAEGSVDPAQTDFDSDPDIIEAAYDG